MRSYRTTDFQVRRNGRRTRIAVVRQVNPHLPIALVLVMASILSFSSRVDCAEPDNIPLSDLFNGKLKIIDLTYTLNEKNPYWPGDKYEPFQLKTIATIEKDGMLSKTLSMPEHLGTHIDAPNHFEKNQPALDKIALDQLFGPGVVLDISQRAEQDADAWLTVADIEAWEKKHGRIPDGAIVMLHTGWGRFWANYDR